MTTRYTLSSILSLDDAMTDRFVKLLDITEDPMAFEWESAPEDSRDTIALKLNEKGMLILPPPITSDNLKELLDYTADSYTKILFLKKGMTASTNRVSSMIRYLRLLHRTKADLETYTLKSILMMDEKYVESFSKLFGIPSDAENKRLGVAVILNRLNKLNYTPFEEFPMRYLNMTTKSGIEELRLSDALPEYSDRFDLMLMLKDNLGEPDGFDPIDPSIGVAGREDIFIMDGDHGVYDESLDTTGSMHELGMYMGNTKDGINGKQPRFYIALGKLSSGNNIFILAMIEKLIAGPGDIAGVNNYEIVMKAMVDVPGENRSRFSVNFQVAESESLTETTVTDVESLSDDMLYDISEWFTNSDIITVSMDDMYSGYVNNDDLSLEGQTAELKFIYLGNTVFTDKIILPIIKPDTYFS